MDAGRLDDAEEAKLNMDAWWDGELRGRPVHAFSFPRNDVAQVKFDPWHLAKHPDDASGFANLFEAAAACQVYGGELLPNLHVNYGPGVLAAVLGVEPRFVKKTVWFDRPTDPTDLLPLLEAARLDSSNEWYARLKRVTEQLARRATGRYQVGVTDLGGVLDVISSFVGPKALIVEMKRRPGLVDAWRAVVLEKWHRLYDELQAIIGQCCDGCNAWLNAWCRRRWYPIQCDFSAMLSPKWFRRFVLPDLEAQAERLDYSVYHLDGPHELPYLDDLLSLPALTGIQWVPGAGQPHAGDPKWFRLYDKVQQAGKNLVISAPPESVPALYDRLDPRGLYVHCEYPGEVFAEFYLPRFLGGMGGVDPEESGAEESEEGK
ncbi:MAG: hypothetical protein Kow0069_00440 [Promethearchaeota archaeon]